MKMVSSHLSVQKLIFFKERERRGSTRRESNQPDESKNSNEYKLLFKRVKRDLFQGKGEEGIN
jgi:hypothetical protein